MQDGFSSPLTEEEAPTTWRGRLVADVMDGDDVQVTLRASGADYLPLGREEKLQAGARYVLVRRRELRAHGTRRVST